MGRFIILLSMGIVFPLVIGLDLTQPAQAEPVLLELFTSEGCSSCPPAERLVGSLAKERTGELVLISEHVDYWNRLGWPDPYASKDNTNRQYSYSRALGRSGVYTPQVVVDGHLETVGNNRAALEEVIARARKSSKKGSISLSRAGSQSDGSINLSLSVSNLPEPIESEVQRLFAAVVLNEVNAKVMRGENANRVLTHYSVLTKLVDLGPVNGGTKSPVKFRMKVMNKARKSVVFFVQGEKSKRIYAVLRSLKV